MKVKAHSRRHRTIEQDRAELSTRLEARRPEIEAAVTTRVYSVSDLGGEADTAYVDGLKRAISAAIDYGLTAVELGEDGSPPPPPTLLAQARLASRNGIGLDTVLRRYFAGHALLGDFLVEEALRGDLDGCQLQRVLRTQATLFDRLLAAVSEDHIRESRQRRASTERRKAEKIERLLAGEMVDVSQLEYNLKGHHLALVAQGEGVAESIRDLAQSLDRRLLWLPRDDHVLWAWLGGRRQLDAEKLARYLSSHWPRKRFLALGVPSQGLFGWRLGHRQAEAALPVARRGSESIVHYADVAMLAAAFQDELLATSLRQLYLEPLEAERDGGEIARETLRAYFAAGRNVSAAAAALGIQRHTVSNRLRVVELRLGRPIEACASGVEVGLGLKRLTDPQ